MHLDRLYIFIPGLAAFFATIDINLLIAMAGIVLTVALAPRYFRNRDLKADKVRLDDANHTLQKVLDSRETRIKQLETDLAGAQARANAAQVQSTEWKSRYDAIKPFTAQPAFERLADILEQMDQRHDDTHQLIRRLVGEFSMLPPDNNNELKERDAKSQS